MIELASHLEVKTIPLSDIEELNEEYWYGNGTKPSCRNIVEHAKLIGAVDLSFPIILCNQGRVMDGMHRVCKALMEGHETIRAVQFENEIEPDYVGVLPDELPY